MLHTKQNHAGKKLLCRKINRPRQKKIQPHRDADTKPLEKHRDYSTVHTRGLKQETKTLSSYQYVRNLEPSKGVHDLP